MVRLIPTSRRKSGSRLHPHPGPIANKITPEKVEYSLPLGHHAYRVGHRLQRHRRTRRVAQASLRR